MCKKECYLDENVVKNIRALCKEINADITEIVVSAIMAVYSKHTRQEQITAAVVGKQGDVIWTEARTDENLSYCEFLLDVKREWGKLQQKNEKADFYVSYGEISDEHDTSVVIDESKDQIILRWNCKMDYFAEHVVIFLKKIGENADKILKEIELLSEDEKALVVKTFNQNHTEYDRNETVIELFEQQVRMYPNNKAVLYKNQSLTYKQFNEKVNALADYLRKSGIKPNEFVMISAERSIELVVAIYAVLKAGGAYISVSPSIPEERVRFMIQDCNAKCILKLGEFAIKDLAIPVIDLQEKDIYAGSRQNPVRVNSVDDICYMIYTSGTTGKPKGVVINHHCLRNLVQSFPYIFGIGKDDVILQFASTSFDQSVGDIFAIVNSAAALCMIPEDYVRDIEKLEEYMNEQKVTYASLTPMLVQELHSENLPMLRILDCGGEAGKLEVLRRWAKNRRVINSYGPSETTVNATWYPVTSDTEKLYIGKPVNNTQIYMLDGMTLCGVGVIGELCIAGESVGKGYLKQEELTNEKFIDNPFGEGKLYRSGDLACWSADGNIDYMGRIDEQVKIRGFRIELGEIDSVLRKQPYIENVAVITKEVIASEKAICAYVVAEKELSMKDIRDEMAKELPSYMLPAYMMQVKELPVTRNGKLDKRALPDISEARMESYEAPKTELEKTLCSIYEELLDIKNVGRNDSFFDLGGHSLKATYLKNKISEKTKKVIELRDIFLHPVISELAVLLENAKDNAAGEIESVEKNEYYETSPAQKRMYISQKMEKETTAYNIPVMLEITGNVEKSKLETAFRELIKRHETLRTVFFEKDGNIVQKIREANDVDFSLDEITVNSREELKEKFLQFVCPFDLSKDLLIRARLVHTNEQDYLFMDVHHISSDAASSTIIQNELCKLYKGTKLSALTVQYKDYIAWDKKNTDSSDREEAKSYWLSQFSGELPLEELPCDYRRGRKNDFDGKEYVCDLEGQELQALRAACKKENVTLFAMMMSSYMLLLSKMINTNDVIVGIPVNNRNHSTLESMVGMFLNTIAIRTKVEEKESFSKLLRKVNKAIVDGMSYQSFQFEELIESLHIKRESNRTPLFDTIMNFVSDAMESTEYEEGQIQLKEAESDFVQAKYDITWYINDYGHKVEIRCNYKTSLFKESSIAYIVKEFVHVLKQAGENTKRLLDTIGVFEKEERKKNPVVINKPHKAVNFDKNKHLVLCIEDIAKKQGNAPAIKMGNDVISYDTLRKRTNYIASRLIECGVENGDKVSLLCGHNSSMILAMLGVLKAGATFVPLQNDYPVERLSYIINDTESKVLLADQKNYEKGKEIAENNGNIVLDQVTENEKDVIPEHVWDVRQNAYIMYTSGSTGRPKGVVQGCDSIAAFMSDYINELKLDEKDRMVLVSACNHATGIIDIFSTLMSGGCILPYDIKEGSGMKGLMDLVNTEKITVFHAVPSVYRYMLKEKDIDNKTALRVIILGGESLQKSDVESYREHFSDNCYFVNLFGSSEVLIATSYVMDKNTSICLETVPIGYLVPQMNCYILNQDKKEMGVYGAGEIVYQSEYLARGYYCMPEQTKKAFGENPITKEGTVYYSGDLGKIMPDGRLEYLGRKDNQIKIRGYRIEIDEIEAVMNQVEGIGQGVVRVFVRDNKENYLVAYYTKEKEEIQLEDAIREKIAEMLPDYMMPSVFVELDKMPLTANAKVDRQALPVVQIDKLEAKENEKPESETEKKVADLYKEVLEVKEVGRNDNFFMIGGHSLKAMMFKNKLFETFGKTVDLSDIFEYPTVCKLAARIDKMAESENYGITAAGKKEYYITSAAQKRMYAAQQMNEESTAYSIPVLYEVTGNVEDKQIEQAFLTVIDRHETLRTTFFEKDGELYQIVHDTDDISFSLEYKKAASKEDEKNIYNHFVRPFDLTKEIPVRACLIETQEKRKLLINVHHINSDVTSVTLLINELECILRKEALKPIRFHYKDYAEWEEKNKKNIKWQQAREYWLTEFDGYQAANELPLDYHRKADDTFKGNEIDITINQTLLNKLRGQCKENNVTLFVFMMAAYNAMLSKMTNSEDVIVGVPVNNRSDKELENMFGMFLNTVAIRNKVDKKETFESLLQAVNQKVTNGIANQSYQIEELMDELHVVRDKNRTPLFDTVMNFVNVSDEERHKEEKEIQLVETATPEVEAKYDITWYVYDYGEKVELICNYKSSLWKKETMQYIVSEYIKLLEKLSDDSKKVINEYNIFAKDLIKNSINPVKIAKKHTPLEIAENMGLVDMLCKTAEKCAKKPALVDENVIITYEEMMLRTNAIAKNIKTHTKVALLCGHNFNMILAMVAALKAGATFVPLDAQYPKERLLYIIEDTGTDSIIVDSSHRGLGEELQKDCDGVELYEIGNDTEEEMPKQLVTGETAAYIMYTSGSTGKPKGVIQSYDNIRQFMTDYINDFKLDSDDRMLLVSSCNHATGIIDIFSTLLSGGCLYPYDIKKGKGISGIIEILNNEKITVFHAVPSVYRYMLREKDKKDKTSLRLIVLGGESVEKSDVTAYKEHFSDSCYLVNLFGSSEVLIATSYVMDKQTQLDGDIVPVGYLVPCMNCKIISEDGEEKGVYGVGEILYDSNYLAKGYWKNEKVTKNAFLSKDGKTYYKSGDLGMLRPDGRLEYLGRKDHQVKIRGYRIELNEIEAVMNGVEGVIQAVVKIFQKKNGENYLAAYYTVENEDRKNEIKEAIRQKLPTYMMPTTFTLMDKMPLTANAKVDRQALKEPKIAEKDDIKHPQGALEEELCSIYEKVLEIASVGRNDNFFELGGHSLKAMLLKNLIYEKLGKVVSLGDILANPTVAELAKVVKAANEDIQKITRVEKKEYYEVSAAQQRMYIAQSKDRSSIAYNIPLVLDIHGELDEMRLEESFNKLIERHETLRTNFIEKDAKIWQVVHNTAKGFVLEKKDVTTQEEEQVIKQFIRPFDLEHDCLIRAMLLTCGNEKKLLLDMHHINSDVTSMGLLQHDLLMIYDNKQQKPLEVQYKDYVSWERKHNFSKEHSEAEKYWLEQFSGEIKTGEIKTDYKRSQVPNVDGAEYVINLPDELINSLRRLGKQKEVTVFAIMLSAYSLLLEKLSNSDDVIVGAPVNNRNLPELEPMIGMFLNTIAIRIKVDEKKTFEELLQTVNKKIVDGMNYQSYQFEDLIQALHIKQEENRTPLFDTVMNYVSENTKNEYENKDSIMFELHKTKESAAKYDMTWYLYDFGDTFEITCNYKTGLFKQSTIEYLMDEFVGLLRQVSDNPVNQLNEYHIFDINQIAGKKNPVSIKKEHKPFVKERDLVGHLEQVAEKYGNLAAFKEDDRIITYKEMDERANLVAHALLERGVGKESVVGLLCGHNSDMVISMIAVLKAGATFVPLDKSYPKDRQEYIINDTNASVLIVDDESTSIDIKNIYQITKERRSDAPVCEQGEIAYIMYTSGSTGKPKGVVQTRENIVAFMEDYINELKLDENDRMALVSACNHATGIIDIFSTLLSGGCLYPYDIKKGDGIKGLAELIMKEKITVFHAVPSVYRYLIKELNENKHPKVRVIVLGGESLQKADVDNYHKYFNDDCYFINLFGSSEVLIATSYVMDKETKIDSETVPVGYPVPKVSCHMVSSENKTLGIYGEGEIVYESGYLAKGYFNRKEQTNKAFHNGCYYSGDIGKMLPDGRLEFLGRRDHQIKIRGYRIEIDEIEAVMDKVEGIGQGAVKAFTRENGEWYLVAYYTKENPDISIEQDIKMALKEELPSYMMPSCFVELQKMPLSSNAKIDRQALKEPKNKTVKADDNKPETETQKILCRLFEEVLEVQNVGIHDNFFELGGHSLKAMELKMKINEVLKKEADLNDIFANPTVEELEHLLKEKQSEGEVVIPIAGKKEYYEVSSAQKRMYLAHVVNGASTAYNNPKIYEIQGDITKEKIKEIYTKIIMRHESLRTGFVLQGEEIRQKVYPMEELSFEVEEYTCKTENEIQIVIDEFVKPFDLEKPPLIRIGILKLDTGKKMLLYDVHHIVTDGSSFQIINRDLVDIYNNKPLEDIPVTYKDYAEWVNKRENSELFKEHEEYWVNEFSDIPEKIQWPYSVQNHEERDAIYDQIVIPKEQLTLLENITKKTGATLFMILLGSFAVTLSDISGQEEMVIGSTNAGRVSGQLRNVVGVFINDFAIKTKLMREETFTTYLQQIRKKVIEAYKHQDYPHDKLVEKLSGQELFNVMLVLENIKGHDVKAEGFALEPYDHIRTKSKFDLYCGAIQYEEEVVLGIEYSKGIFDKTSREAFSEHWKRVLENIASDPDQKLKTLGQNQTSAMVEESSFDADFEF